jgi:hypothetical protein
MPSARSTLHPHLPQAPILVTDVRLAATPRVSAARTLLPALIADLLLLLIGAVATVGVSFAAHHASEGVGRLLILAGTFVVIIIAALLLRRGAKHGRPAMWATMVCIAWGVLAAMWVPGFILNSVPGTAWSQGVFTGESVPAVVGNAVLVQALLFIGVLIPALLAPETLRGWARGFFTAAAVGLGYGGMQAVLVLSGRHLVGLASDAGIFASAHGMWLPVLQAFASGWGGMVLGLALRQGKRSLFYGWPIGVVVAAVVALVFGSVIRARALCQADVGSASWCHGSEPDHTAVVFAWISTCLLAVALAVTTAALGRRHADLRSRAMEGLVANGWYTPDEAQAFSERPSRKAFLAWAGQRGGRAQARHVMATADHLIQLRLEIEDLPDPQPRPHDPRPGLVAEQDAALKRSLSARESLRTAVAHGPGGWTAS